MKKTSLLLLMAALPYSTNLAAYSVAPPSTEKIQEECAQNSGKYNEIRKEITENIETAYLDDEMVFERENFDEDSQNTLIYVCTMPNGEIHVLDVHRHGFPIDRSNLEDEIIIYAGYALDVLSRQMVKELAEISFTVNSRPDLPKGVTPLPQENLHKEYKPEIPSTPRYVSPLERDFE